MLKNSSKAMKSYVYASSCRQRYLFRDFLSFSEKDIKVTGCKCCDIVQKLVIVNIVPK